MEKQLLVLFDGNAIVHRAYHAFSGTKTRAARPLTVPGTGEVVSAVYGFASMLLKVLGDLKPSHIAVAFDKKGPTFRHDMFVDYKAQRPETPSDLIAQFGRVKQVVKAFNIPFYELDKFEADDVLGTLSRQAAEKGMDVVIVTGDADSMQLVSPHIKVLYPKGGATLADASLFDADMVKEKFGVGPEHVADYKALVGDPSDNIKGVPGIGEKTAVKLITEFGGVDDIYKNLDKVAPPRIQEILRANESVARESKTLTTIVTDTPITLDLPACVTSDYDRQKVVDLFRELAFRSLLEKLPGAPPSPGAVVENVASEVKSASPAEYITVADVALLDEVVNRLSSAGLFAFDTETTGLDAMTVGLVGVSLSVEPGKAWYIPVGHQPTLGGVTQLALEEVIAKLKPVFEDEKVRKVGHNAKFDMNVLASHGIDVKGLFSDTMIVAHLLGEPSVGLKALAFSKLGVEMTNIETLIGKGSKQISMANVPVEAAAPYAAADADMTLRLELLLKPELEKQGPMMMKLFTEVEMPLVPVLLLMERNGMLVDTGILKDMSGSLGTQITALEKQIYLEADQQFNINSPSQLGSVLFHKFQITEVRKGQDKYTTEASLLEDLLPRYPFLKYILEYRQLTKIKGTYIDALPPLINSKTGRIHTSFNQTRTSTGRLSSTDPNMQNIPVRGELGGQVRQAFIAAPGFTLFAADYSQIDLRALAHLSADNALVTAFCNDEDIHSATAQLLFGVEKDKVTKDMRRFAKTINFGVIYGMSEYGLEQATGLSRADSSKFIKTYFDKYPGVVRYLDGLKEKARRDGYVETLLGRRRYFGPDIHSTNRQLREGAERMAINMPVQGTSADIIKVAMINLAKEMEKQKLKSRLLLQVHDELVFEVPPEEETVMRSIVPDIMNCAVKLIVPLKVETKSGPNWGEMR
jgi:DNA polymerase I